MGILTLLRNAFGRSRKGRTAEAEGATPSQEPQPTATTTATATVPEPRSSEPEKSDTENEHDLVSAAFDNVTVPKQSPAAAESEPAAQAEEPATEPKPAAEAATETPKPEQPATEEPKAEAETPKAEEQPEPTAEPEPAPVAEAEPEPSPEPETAPEPVAEAEQPEAPKAEEQPEPATAEPEPVAEAAPEPEAEVEEPEAPKAEAEPEPAAAADDEEAPQGPPAPDDESSTGGAGGNEKAEGEAEAEETPVPTNLRTAHTAAAKALATHNLTGTRAKTYLVLDRSASMRPYYKDGSAQALAEQTLALAAHLDDKDPSVHVVFFSTELDGTGELTLTEHENKIDELHAGLGRMGRTSYHVAVEEVVAHHAKTAPATPALVVFQTDGAPDAKTPANQALTDAAKKHPNVFFSIVAFGDPEQKAFDYLRKLKTGNTATFFAGESPLELTDDQLYDGILSSWRP
ncbi:VWA domain-containing protein [Streptomyces sp. RK62]|uniref:VWA domain-containing protein n=1 Tax=Streptomyces sp. RK62 TaxID=2824893 RepID=UPI001B37A480|nr:VWA domain-containing protein [Streptomyces sp. RK62]MBQ0998063.1 VWA domain-containing protein [Streptomyces sp. RK62]